MIIPGLLQGSFWGHHRGHCKGHFEVIHVVTTGVILELFLGVVTGVISWSLHGSFIWSLQIFTRSPQSSLCGFPMVTADPILYSIHCDDNSWVTPEVNEAGITLALALRAWSQFRAVSRPQCIS